MRLSPFHKQIAKLVAQGLPNREIKKKVKISDSRLSVLKHNPLMIREIEKQTKLEETKYAKALEVFGGKAEKVADKLVKMVTNEVGISDKVRAELGMRILDTLAQGEGYGQTKQGSGGTEESFEQVLRLTRSTGGQAGIDEETLQQAFIELEEENDANEANEEDNPQTIEMESIVGAFGQFAQPEPGLRADDADEVVEAELCAPGCDDGGMSPTTEQSGSNSSNGVGDDLLEMLSG